MKLNHLKQFEEYYWVQDENESIFDLNIPKEEYTKKILNAMNIPYNTISHLADGGYGVAVDLNDGTVLKITTDKSEAFYAHKLISISSPNLVQVYDVKQIESKYQYGTLYAIHMEKLDTDVVGSIKHLIDYLHKYNPITPQIRHSGEVSDQDVIEFFKNKLVSLPDESILLLFNKWLAVYKECEKYNLPFDDFHSKNVGISKRSKTDLVFFDIASIHEIREVNTDSIPKITLE